MMKTVSLIAALALLAGCAKPVYTVDRSGATASVTYLREDVNHYIAQDTGAVVPEDRKDTYRAPLIWTEFTPSFPTVVYLYRSAQCSGGPVVMGRLDRDRGPYILTREVKAGVPLVNSYRTKFQTCDRDCYKHFYTSSVFTPEPDGRYEVVIEPIDGTRVYKLVEGGRTEVETGPALPPSCQY